MHITGSDVLSQTATTIVGQNVTIDAAVGSTDTTQTQEVHSGGISVGIGGGVATVVQSLYGDVQGASHSHDSRLKALYAMQAAQDLFSPGAGHAMGLGGGETGAQALANTPSALAHSGSATQAAQNTGVSLHIGIGGGSSRSKASTHDDAAYGSQISSAGNVTLAATKGDLNVIGSQINGNNVTLAASHDINLLSQAEQHTERSSSHNSSGEVGISIGETTGIYLSVAAGEALAHGNGTTHDDTVVNAANDLTLISGNNTTIRGAQAKGNSVLASIGGNLDIASEQDTGDYSSHSLQAGLTLVYGFSGSGVGVSGSLAASKANSKYASVTQISGIGAGSGGFDIHVGGNTSLRGAVIASSASADKNLLDTGSLTYSNIQNKAKSSAESLSIGGGYGTSQFAGMKGISGSIGIPQDDSQSSTTQAGIANGTIVVRSNPNQSLAGLDRDPSLDNTNGVTNSFDPQKVAENQQVGRLAGQVGMTAAGDVEQAAGMQSGSTGAVAIHAIAGGAAAALGGGNAAQGAIGAGTAEAATPYLESKTGNTGTEIGTTLIGAMVGCGAGASTALAGDEYNRQLHPDEIAWIKSHAEAFAQQQCGCDPSSAQVDQATATLAQQALRDVDALWAGMLGGPSTDNATAQSFLATASGTFTNEAGQQQALFTAQGTQFLEPVLYSTGADANFYKTYAQPGIVLPPGAGLTLEMPNAGLSTVQNMANAAATGQLYQGMVNTLEQTSEHPIDTVTGWFKNSGDTLGESAATLSGSVQQNLNAVYGQNVTAEALTLQGVSSAWVAVQVAGAGKMVGEAAAASDGATAATAEVGDAAKAGAAASKTISTTSPAIADATTDAEAGVSQVQGTAMNDFFDQATKSATHSLDSTEVVLGQSIPGSPDSYEAVAQSRGATYFAIPADAWDSVSAELGGRSQMWGINKAFLDQQMAQGKSFLFTSDPASAPPWSFTHKEYDYLLSHGYDLSPDSGGMFRATK